MVFIASFSVDLVQTCLEVNPRYNPDICKLHFLLVPTQLKLGWSLHSRNRSCGSDGATSQTFIFDKNLGGCGPLV